ncbi:MAG: precorrin-3B C(17)-methyltransferase [Marichromatium sp.]|nr:precorrin-3B C(17)-methyltransferase [Marichromatium sp.]
MERIEQGPLLLATSARGRVTAGRIAAACDEINPHPCAFSTESEQGCDEALRASYRAGLPCVVLGEVGAVAVTLAPLLDARGDHAGAVVVVAEDGSAVVPLLGAARGADALAERIAEVLGVRAAITAVEPSRPRPGRLAVVGLGPGAHALMAPAARLELDRAQDIIGYNTYVEMAGPFRPDQVIHGSDNRCEMDRARAAFALAAEGRHVVVVSSGDPGVFAMATAVLEALDEHAEPAWHAVELAVVPGISAAQAAAARIGAPLGHDFCILSLSDNLKPWSQIVHRLELAARADLVIACYNPISRARPWQLGEALAVLRGVRDADTPVVLGRDVGRPAERVRVTTLGALDPQEVDMRTVVIVGSSQTRHFSAPEGRDWVYTPRWYPQPAEQD